ncbi:hypothetical protein IW261DRAFT_1592446 [Armillaria novae-zelandiae]|uniref:Uncharacterized protein n=1 Tax=Armillaria novae-zelandiae TaxID=153914 RepID=A0AA39UB37_9AGAR|nr:hypothetical protein IW261DRAFT_1592446 [Armillaria novae-zelandiae]
MAGDEGARLPQELVDAIIDAVRYALPVSEAFKDLISCSLVSHRFLPRTRYFLFEAISFDSPEEVLSYYNMVLKNPTISSSTRCLVFDTEKLVTDTFGDSFLISVLHLTANIITLLSQLGLYGSLTVGRSDDDGTEALVLFPEKSVFVRSLSVASFQNSQDMIRSILLSPSSPFIFLGLIDTEVAFSRCSCEALSRDGIYSLRDVVSASDSLLLAHINMERAFQRAPPPYLLYLPSLCMLGFILNNANNLGFHPIPVLQ